MKHKLLLLGAFSLAAAAWPFADAAEEIRPVELGILFSAAAVVLAIQCAALGAARRIASESVINVLIAAAIAANAYHFAFLTIDAKTVVRMTLAAVVGVGAWLALRPAAPTLRIAQFALLFMVVSLTHYTYGLSGFARPAHELSAAPASLSVKSDRNVYLISTESLHSPSALRRFYAIENAPHNVYLAQEGFRILDRSYSPDISTRNTYQRIMEFTRTLVDKVDLRRPLWNGNSTFRSFRDGGYKIQFIYISNYMNLNPRLVDHAYPKVGFYVCDNLPDNFFYVICWANVRNAVSKALYGIDGRVSVAQEIAHLKERVKVAASDDRPWLTISHIAYPAHTAKNYKYDDTEQAERFRKEVRGQMRRIADHFRDIVGSIKKNDPQAVIVLFGDHGMTLTRGMKTSDSNRLFTSQDFVEDRYGAMLAVYPADFCPKRIFEGSSTAIVTKSIIECLNGNDNPSPEDLEKSRSVIYLGEVTRIDRLIRGD